MSLTRFATLTLLATLLMGLCAGCGDDEPTRPQEVKFASPDALVQGLVAYYTGMDYPGYAAILDQEFRFVLQPQDLIDCNLAVGHLDRFQEQSMHSRMFAGLSGATCGGDPVPAIEAINVLVFSRTGDTWQPVTDVDSPFVGSRWADHVFRIDFSHAGAFMSRVEGRVRVYARDAGLGNEADWKLTGLDHLPVVKASEDRSWGLMRLFFRGDG